MHVDTIVSIFPIFTLLINFFFFFCRPGNLKFREIIRVEVLGLECVISVLLVEHREE